VKNRCPCCTIALRCVACMSFEPVREDMPDWQDDEADTRPAERIDTKRRGHERDSLPRKEVRP
jgi:hypothetical protein